MVLPAGGESNEGDRVCCDSDVNPPEAEYSRTIYCDTADSGPMHKGHPESRCAGSSAVMVTDED